MAISYIDTHAHLYDEAFLPDQDQVITRLQAAEVAKVLMPNIDNSSIEPMLALQQKHPSIFEPMIGLHPCYVQKNFQQELYQMEAWLKKHRFIAIGEVGIDLYRSSDYKEEQQEALEIQISWGKQYKLPLVFHMRNATKELLSLLRKQQDGTLYGVVHCFAGTLEEAQAIIDLGFALGIGGAITFKNSDLVKMITSIDLKHLVLETDSPYLAPVPYRGKRNEPAYVKDIAAVLATIYRMPIADIAAITTDNAIRVFNLPYPLSNTQYQ